KTFSPMRRSSLYLALLRLLMFGPICLVLRSRSRTARPAAGRGHRFTGVRGQLRSAAHGGRGGRSQGFGVVSPAGSIALRVRLPRLRLAGEVAGVAPRLLPLLLRHADSLGLQPRSGRIDLAADEAVTLLVLLVAGI